jgi:hypothetical protein
MPWSGFDPSICLATGIGTSPHASSLLFVKFFRNIQTANCNACKILFSLPTWHTRRRSGRWGAALKGTRQVHIFTTGLFIVHISKLITCAVLCNIKLSHYNAFCVQSAGSNDYKRDYIMSWLLPRRLCDTFFHNVGNHLQDYHTGLQPRRPQSTISPPWKLQISHRSYQSVRIYETSEQVSI